MVWGSSIYAKVIAFNNYGDSATSIVGNGAVILTNPDAPLSLSEVVASRAATSITISWTAGIKNGGAPVLDYTIYYKQSGGSFTTLKVGEKSLTYTATGLTSGIRYQFYVLARNTFGPSVASSTLDILCATLPGIPTGVQTSNLANTVVLNWNLPPNNGLPI